MRADNRRIVWSWLALLALLALTCASSWWPMGAWNGVVNLGVAAAKAAVVAFVFMHLGMGGAVRACVSVSVFVLLLMFALAASDFMTRDPRPAAWQPPPERHQQ